MGGLMKSPLAAVLLSAMAGFFAPAACATGIPVTGTATFGMWGLFDLTGPQFFASSHPPGGGAGGPGWCTDGACDLSGATEIQAFPHFYPGCGDCGWSAGSLDGNAANLLEGALFLPEFVTIPPLPQDLPPEVTALGLYPFHGDLTGFFQSPDGSLRRVFEVELAGSVQVTLAGLEGPGQGSVHVDTAMYAFTGTATPMPEPASALCLAIGLAMIGFRKLKTSRAN
jgi:hypothetical protein